MLMIMGVVEHPERHIAVFDKAVFAIRSYQKRRIVAGVGKNEGPVGRIENTVDRGNELIVLDRIPQQFADL